MPRTPPILAFLILVSVVLAGILLLRPKTRTVVLQVEGLPTWGFVVADIGRIPATDIEQAAQTLRFSRIRLGPHDVHLRGGIGEDGACRHCCWSATLPLVVPRGQAHLGVSLRLDTVPLSCPSATLPYDMATVPPGPVDVLAPGAEVRAPLLLGQAPVDDAMWDRLMGAEIPRTWETALVCANRLSAAEHLTPAYYHDEAHLFPFEGGNGRPIHWMREASGYHLPTLAEAARAGVDALVWDAALSGGYQKPERVALPDTVRAAWLDGAAVDILPTAGLAAVPLFLARRVSSGYPAP